MRSHRKEKIGSVIQHVVGEAIAHRMQDPRIEPFTTVTRVDVTTDLAIARVYLSVHGDETVERRTLAGVRHGRGFLQREVARELSIRVCPELRFDVDRAAKGARLTMELLEENRRREPDLYETSEPDSAHEAERADSPPSGSLERNGAGE